MDVVCRSVVGANGMKSTFHNVTQVPLHLKKTNLPVWPAAANTTWPTSLANAAQCRNLRETEPKKEQNRIKDKEICRNTALEIEWVGEVCWKCIKTKLLKCFKLNWTLNHFGQGKYDTVLFLLSSKALGRGKDWAKRTKSVCCFSACWFWVESNLSLLFCSVQRWRSAVRSLSRMKLKALSTTLKGPSLPHYFYYSAASCGTELVRVSSASCVWPTSPAVCVHVNNVTGDRRKLGNQVWILCCAVSPTRLGLLTISNSRPPTTQLHAHTAINTFHLLRETHLITLSATAQFMASPLTQTGGSMQGQSQCITTDSFFYSLHRAVGPTLLNTDVAVLSKLLQPQSEPRLSAL